MKIGDIATIEIGRGLVQGTITTVFQNGKVEIDVLCTGSRTEYIKGYPVKK